jgi:hypothetical protein
MTISGLRGVVRIPLAIAMIFAVAPVLFSQTASPSTAVFTWAHRSTIKELAWAWGSEAGITIDGTRIFIPKGGPGLAAYDVANRAAPRPLFRLSSADLGGQAGAVAVAGSRIYVSLPNKYQIAVIDFNESAPPSIAYRFSCPADVLHMDIRGRFLYIHARSSTAYLGGVYIYDLSRTPPKPAGFYPADLVDPGFAVTKEGVVLLARTPATYFSNAKVTIVDLSRPFRIAPLSEWNSSYPGNIVDFDLQDGSLYMAAYWGGLWALDVHDLFHPVLKSLFDWDEPRFYALGVRAWPPFIVLGAGGPQSGDHKFVIFKESGAGFDPIAEIPATALVQSVAGSGPLLVLIEIESPYGNSNPKKILNLYEVSVEQAGQKSR